MNILALSDSQTPCRFAKLLAEFPGKTPNLKFVRYRREALQITLGASQGSNLENLSMEASLNVTL